VLVCPEADARTTNSRNKIVRTEYFTRLILMRSREALRSNRDNCRPTPGYKSVLPNREFSLLKLAATKIAHSQLISPDAVWVKLAAIWSYCRQLSGSRLAKFFVGKTLMRKSHVFRNLWGDLANLIKTSNFWDAAGDRLKSLHALLFEFL
jgi:hypothetical protein